MTLRGISPNDAEAITRLLAGDSKLALQTETIPIPYTIESARAFLQTADPRQVFAVIVDEEFDRRDRLPWCRGVLRKLATGLAGNTGVDFEMILVPHVRKRKWRMWADHGVEFFIHPAMRARPAVGSPGILPSGPQRHAQRLDSGSQVEIVMIKSDAQRERTAAQIEGFRQALTKADREMTGKPVRGSYEGMIRQLEDELHEYDELKSGELRWHCSISGNSGCSVRRRRPGYSARRRPAYHQGTVFQLTPPVSSGAPWKEKVVHTFTSLDATGPLAPLVFDANGSLFGTTSGGVDYAKGNGIIFEVIP